MSNLEKYDWHIDPDITWEEWKESGRRLAIASNTLQWHWGEWWNHGHKKWDRDAEEFIKTLPLKRQTLYNYGSVATLVKPYVRTEDLPFEHHKLIAPLHEQPKEQKMWLKRAKDNRWPASQLREAMKEAYKEDTPLPEGKFNVILSDPPWKYEDGLIEGYGAATHHYPVMTIAELCAMDIPAADNAVLFLWVTSPLLEESVQVITAWCFEYKSSFIWDKMAHNYGHYNSLRHEFLLICTRGSFLPKSKKLIPSVQSVKRGRHSEKPEKFREIIHKMYGPPNEKTHLELFARKRVKGWTPHGNDPELRR
jgi:N6-adenosine-specific RNA methylase IME4